MIWICWGYLKLSPRTHIFPFRIFYFEFVCFPGHYEPTNDLHKNILFIKIDSFAKISRNQQMLIFFQNPATDLSNTSWSTLDMFFKVIRCFLIKLWSFEFKLIFKKIAKKGAKNSIFLHFFIKISLTSKDHNFVQTNRMNSKIIPKVLQEVF